MRFFSFFVFYLTFFIFISIGICKKPLQFNSNNKFKVVQLADLHFGEKNGWKDEKTRNVIRQLIKYEQPDLIVFTGDQLHSDDIGKEKKNATSYWKQMIMDIEKANIPWAVTFGNHDDYKGGKYYTTREELLKFDQSHTLSYTQQSSSTIAGLTNYILPIHSIHSTSQNPIYSAGILLLDSGGGSIPIQIHQSQLNWIQNKLNEIQNSSDWLSYKSNIIAYMHYAPKTVQTLHEQYKWGTLDCIGTFRDEPNHSGGKSNELLDVLNKNYIHSVYVGHNHGINYCCPYQSKSSITQSSPIQLCFGRQTGYAGWFGFHIRGARVVEFTESSSKNNLNPIQIRTWMRLENGKKLTYSF